MNRLNFSLPEFTRIVWASDKAKKLWQPRIDAINTAWFRIERASVIGKMRLGGLQNVAPENLIDFQKFCQDADIGYSILSQEGSSGTYSNAAHPVRPGRPWVFRVYFGFSPKEFYEYWQASDEKMIGHFLGYPSCCTEFFSHYWKDEGWRDLTYPMILNDGKVNGPYECNILLRHLGVRPVFHLPCSFHCMSTCRVADDILSYRNMGFEKEISWIIDILNWPVRWSSLHGVAIITTPVVKIITSTDALDERRDIDREGIYPEAGVSGTEFPFRPMQRSSPLSVIKDVWTDNGFKSYTDMNRAHKLILETIAKIGVSEGTVLDLGSGNGILLQKIERAFPTLSPFGVESDRARFAKSAVENVHLGNIFDHREYLIGRYELALIALNRFFEVEPTDMDLLLEHLKEHVNYLIVYSYEPWKYNLDPVIYRNFSLVHVELDGSTEARVLKPNKSERVSER